MKKLSSIVMCLMFLGRCGGEEAGPWQWMVDKIREEEKCSDIVFTEENHDKDAKLLIVFFEGCGFRYRYISSDTTDPGRTHFIRLGKEVIIKK